MSGVATPTQPRTIPGSRSAAPNAATLSIPQNTLSVQPNSRSPYNALSPVTQNGSYEFDRIIKAGELLKRTRKTKSWKSVYIVIRPGILSIYKDKQESKLRHQVSLPEVTAVARQKDPKRKDKHIFGLFSPSRNFHFEAPSSQEAQAWVECIRQEAKIDEQEEEFYLSSPTGTSAPYAGFGRSIDASIHPLADEQAAGYSSSDAEALAFPTSLPRRGDRGFLSRRLSHMEYSGAEQGDFSDFSDSAFEPTARMSSLSLAHPNARPPTSSTNTVNANLASGPSAARITTGLTAPPAADDNRKNSTAQDEERVISHGWIYLLKSKSGVRRWSKVWMVLRPKALAIYKNEDEYAALMILPFTSIIDVVEIDPISKSKTACMQIISEERNFRFCALDEEALARWLGAFKSLLSKRRAKASVTVGV